MDDLLVSIGLLTYNHEKYISNALEGLLSQEYERIELIILDDASNDNTSLIIEQYMQRLKEKFIRVTYIRNEKNSGNIPRNCNHMMRLAKGELYYAISGDDILLPFGISLLQKALVNHPECIAVHANMIQVQDTYNLEEKIDMTNPIWKNKKSGVEEENLFYRLMYRNCIAAPTVMIRKETFAKYGYHNEEIDYEDYEYWLRISRKEKFYYLETPVVLYRISETSVTNFGAKDSCKRLWTAMISDFQSKKLYIEQLSKDESAECWRLYYTNYVKLCEQYQYQEGLIWLENKRKELHIDECTINCENILKRSQKETELLEEWAKIKNVSQMLGDYLKSKKICNVALYGYSNFGKFIHSELVTAGVHVEYVIDRKGRMLECICPVYTIDESLPFVDAVIVAPVGLYEEVEPILSEKRSAKVLDLCNIIEELIRINEP